jgi:hypothetical protein
VAYGWGYDQLVLLLPYLQIVAWRTERYHGDLVSNLPVPIGLLCINGLIPWSKHIFRDDIYLLWAPPAWGLLHVTARRVLRHQWLGPAPVACVEDRA